MEVRKRLTVVKEGHWEMTFTLRPEGQGDSVL